MGRGNGSLYLTSGSHDFSRTKGPVAQRLGMLLLGHGPNKV